MKTMIPLPTQNKDWGFCGTCEQTDYDTLALWDATSRFFIEHFNLTPEQARELLDARFGRHLVDDFSFITGEVDAVSVENHLLARIADRSWHKYYAKSIHEETGVKIPTKKPATKDELFTEIAQQHLHMETLQERKSDRHDFKEVSVLGVKAALEAAYAAGQASKKGA